MPVCGKRVGSRTWWMGECDEPGPGDSHCTDRPGHDWSCYDARGDVSFNARQDWTHRHPGCPDDGHVSEYC